jgi:hypothetical protein
MSNEQEWRRLQGLYAAMSDGELLHLAGEKVELTAVAQQAIDAEMSKRGLEMPVEEEPLPDAATPDLPAAEGDPSLVTLLVSQSAVEANKAATCLEEAEIAFELRPQRYRDTDDGPWKTSGLLEIVVESERKQDAVRTLREKMGLFPLAEVNERDGDTEASEDEEFYQVGSFDLEEDGEVASKALRDAGIWFKSERIAVDSTGRDEGPLTDCTFIDVRFEDLERAVEVVGAAFPDGE